MSRTSLILGLSFVLALAGVLHAQRGGIDPAAIATEAGKMFAGKDCELCTNANWVTKSKGL